jgi:hypothetical protein
MDGSPVDDLSSSIFPSDEELKRWESLDREEQLQEVRRELQLSIDSGISERSMEEIRQSALDRIASREDG